MTCKVITVLSGKGGTLKTSVATNLASVLSKKGNKVLIIEMDWQGNVGTSFGVNADGMENTVYDVMVNDVDINKAIVNINNNLDLLLANDDMIYFEMDIFEGRRKNRFNLLSKAVKEARNDYDYILIDTPPSMSLSVTNALNVTDDVLVTYHPEVYALRSLVKTIELIENFKKKNPKLIIKGVLPVKVKKTKTHRAYTKSAVDFCYDTGIRFLNNLIPESIIYAESIGINKAPLCLINTGDKKEIKYQNVYFNLAEELNY